MYSDSFFSPGNFQAGDSGAILKKLCPKEHRCLEQLMNDVLRPYVPKYIGNLERDGNSILSLLSILPYNENVYTRMHPAPNNNVYVCNARRHTNRLC